MTERHRDARPTTGLLRRVAAVLTVLSALLAVGCSGPTRQQTQSATALDWSSAAVDWRALDASLEPAIRAGPPGLDNIRAVVISVDGQTKLAHYRHGSTADDHEHVWSVTKSIVATLIGIAIDDGLIKSLDQPLTELLPEHSKSMTPKVSGVTLRQLMSMSGGFTPEDPALVLYENAYSADGDFIDFLLERGALLEPGKGFAYSNTSAHLAIAVLASALQRSDSEGRQAVLAYARAKLFEPLGIRTEPAYAGRMELPLPDAFSEAGFGWLTDPDGMPYGGFGLRLTPSDMIKIGELYRNDGMWHGVQVIPRGWAQQVSAPGALNQEYGLLWWTTADGAVAPPYAAAGAYGQRIIVWPAHHAVIAVLTASPPSADRNLDITAILDAVTPTALPR